MQNIKYQLEDARLGTVHKHKKEQFGIFTAHQEKMQGKDRDHQFRMLQETSKNQQQLADKAVSVAQTTAICGVVGQGLGALGQFGSSMALRNSPMGRMGGSMLGYGDTLGGGMPAITACAGSGGASGMQSMMPLALGLAGGAAGTSLLSSHAPLALPASGASPFEATPPPQRRISSMMALEDNADVSKTMMDKHKTQQAQKRGLSAVAAAQKKARMKSAAVEAAEKRAAAAALAASSCASSSGDPRCFITEEDDDAPVGVYSVP